MAAARRRRKNPPFAAILVALACACGGEPEPPAELVGPRNLVPVEHPGTLVVEKLVYVPIYSSIYVSDRARPIDIIAMLSLRNMSETVPVVLTRVDYYHSDGHLLRSLLEGPQELGPMQTAEYVIPAADRSGGSGANFMVGWGMREPGPDLLVEALMHGRDGNAGVSFLTEGRVVSEAKSPRGE